MWRVVSVVMPRVGDDGRVQFERLDGTMTYSSVLSLQHLDALTKNLLPIIECAIYLTCLLK